MKETFYLVAISGVALAISSIANGFNDTYKKIHEVEQRIERMKQNPSPVYEHYPNPE